MPKNYATIVHEWFEEVWNQRDVSTIYRLLALQAAVHGIPGGGPMIGPKAFAEFHTQFLNAFPDISVEVAATVSQGDLVAARCIVRGTHRGDGLGIQATQRKTEFTGMCLARVQNGKIVEAWNNFDFVTMHAQLGTLASLVQNAG